MSSARRYAFGLLVLVIAATHFLAMPFHSFIEGVVEDDSGPVARATVGWQGEPMRAVTDIHGRFRIPRSPQARPLTATKPGYRLASSLSPTLRLAVIPRDDNDNYPWIDPHPDSAGSNNCGNCHDQIYREWQASAHAKSATNPRFLSLFAGSDGNSPPHKTWNARQEHPDGAAVCATCHVPTLTSPTLEYDVREAEGVHKSGIHCDYCHKVADVPAGKFGTRFGRDGMMLLRPPADDLLTFGPFDDAVRKGESFAHRPVYKESRYCAACHEGIIFGVHAYGTYSEWLDSPAKTQGKQCQDCHMTPTGTMTNIAPKHGGVERDPWTLASHRTPGGQLDMLRRSLSMKMNVKQETRSLRVEIEVVAQHVGHRVPTGFPDRHLILAVKATDANDRRVVLVAGPRLPSSAGKGSGFAGSLFAKQLVDEHGRTPTPFWRHVDKVEDTRLFPDRPEVRVFEFPPTAKRVTAQLWYRRFWQEVAAQRGWEENEFLVVEKTVP